jgi:hypothetical protein
MNCVSIDCHSSEKLIIKKQLAQLTVEETERLDAHLKSCTVCYRFHQYLSNLHKTLMVTETGLPAPKPEILPLLQQRIRERISVKVWSGLTLPETLLNILRHPIPLYQAAAAIFLAVGIAAFIQIAPGKNAAESAKLTPVDTPQHRISEHYINYYPTQSTLPMKLGINAAEDTSFNSILFSTL